MQHRLDGDSHENSRLPMGDTTGTTGTTDATSTTDTSGTTDTTGTTGTVVVAHGCLQQLCMLPATSR
ncbi:MAG: hypothetical protein A07HN63_01994 [uncultured archaeon A07HN63]|nr:MAG: hypothetical protein A07HN63_01994 [uncultured archaeon A07HN63]